MELVYVQVAYAWLRGRWEAAKADESGGVAERVVLIALFVGLAIVAGMIIYKKVIDKANSIDTTTP